MWYAYDLAGRCTAVKTGTSSETLLQSFEHDALGRMIAGEDENDTGTSVDDVVSTWAYDTLGRVVEESQKIGSGDPRVTTMEYVSMRRTALVYPNDRQINYGYHAGSNLLETITDDGETTPIVMYDYIGGRVLKRGMQNDVNLYAEYDLAGRPVEWVHHDDTNTTIVVGFKHDYDRAGNKLSQVSLHDPRDSQRYAYDSANRLTAFSRGYFGENMVEPESPAYCDVPTTETWAGMVQAQQFKLDGVGNWKETRITSNSIQRIETRSSTSFNEYYDVGGETQDHDDNGNQSFDGTKTYTWDAFNRLRSVSDTTGTIVTYIYDVTNRRMRKDIETGRAWIDIEYAYAGWQVLEQYETGALTNPKRQFIYGNYIDEPLVMDVNGDDDGSCIETNGDDDRYFYHQNTIYSIYALTDDDGQLVEAYAYDPYGQHWLVQGIIRTLNGISIIGNPYLFTGREWDNETENYCHRHRYRNEDSFLSRDPLGFIGGIDLYAYADNAPTSKIDPDGNLPRPSQCDKCGIDVTRLMSNAMSKIEMAFKSGTYPRQELYSRCFAIATVNGWDVKELKEGGGPTPLRTTIKHGCSTGRCSSTVMYSGQCYPAGDVNYMLFGKINKLCYDEFNKGIWYGDTFSLNWAYRKAVGYSFLRGRTEWQVNDLKAWIGHGYKGSAPPTARHYKECKKCPDNTCDSPDFTINFGNKPPF